MDLNEIQKEINRQMALENNRPMPEFEGYSPNEMHHIMYFPFGQDNPLKFMELSAADYQRIPLLNQIKYLLDLIEQAGELKLTSKGFLPVKIVADIYQKGFLKDEHIESGYQKLYKETDAMTINLSRILIEISGLVKKRNGKLSLTKASQKTRKNDAALLRLLFLNFANEFNWAYYDGCDEERIAQIGWGFSLILLSKHGSTKKDSSFYAEKYFRAFPSILSYLEPGNRSAREIAYRCYTLRFFKRFIYYFGLIEMEELKQGSDRIIQVRKTDLYDKLIQLRPHRDM